MIRLITSYYTDSDVERQKEIDFCLEKNINNNFIDEILILNETDSLPLKSKKIKEFKFSRPKFSDFFKIINSLTKENDINILTDDAGTNKIFVSIKFSTNLDPTANDSLTLDVGESGGGT